MARVSPFMSTSWRAASYPEKTRGRKVLTGVRIGYTLEEEVFMDEKADRPLCACGAPVRRRGTAPGGGAAWRSRCTACEKLDQKAKAGADLAEAIKLKRDAQQRARDAEELLAQARGALPPEPEAALDAHLDDLRKELDGERLALARQAEETQALRAERDTLCDRAASAEAEVLALKGRLDDEDAQHRLTKNTLLAFDLQTKLVLSELEIAREEARTLNLAREEALQEVSAVKARMISVKALLDKDAKASQVWQTQAEEMRSKIEAANEDNAALHGTIDELRLALDEVRRGAKQSERVVNHLQGLLDRQRGSAVAAAAELERLRAELTASRNEAALLLGSVERLGGLNKIKTGMISTLSLIMVVLGVICVWL